MAKPRPDAASATPGRGLTPDLRVVRAGSTGGRLASRARNRAVDTVATGGTCAITACAAVGGAAVPAGNSLPVYAGTTVAAGTRDRPVGLTEAAGTAIRKTVVV